MTRKTDNRRLASFFPLEEGHIVSSIYFPPSHNHHHKTRTLDFEMLYDVKSSVSFPHVHCDYGHAYLTCTIWSGKETATIAVPYATWCFDAHCCPNSPESYLLFLTHALWRNAYLTYQVWSEKKATPTVSPLDFLLSFFVSSLVSPFSVVVKK